MRPKALFGIVERLAREGHGTKTGVPTVAGGAVGFFRWRGMPPSDRAIRRAWLSDVIREIHERSRRTYGWRRVRAELDDAYGQRVNKKLIPAIMRELGISGLPARRRGKPNLINRAATVDLVNREFDRDGPNQLWMTDITEHPTREGKLYCCAVLDALSRKTVGWSSDRRPTAAMVNAALGMAVEQRRPPKGTLIHSDQLNLVNSRHGPSVNASGTRGSRIRSEPSETRTTTPWSNRSGAGCRPNSSTPGSGRRGSSFRARSSTGSSVLEPHPPAQRARDAVTHRI